MASRDYIPSPWRRVLINLLPKLVVRVDLRRHSNDSSAARDSSRRTLFRIVGGRSSREDTERPGECILKKRMQMLAASTTPGQLNHFTALVFKQHSKQSTLRKGQRRFFHDDHNV